MPARSPRSSYGREVPPPRTHTAATEPSDQGPSDQELLRAHVAGDDRAFGSLFARHRDRLWAVALRTTGDPEEAADALQDAMVAAFRRAASYRGEAAVTTWLHRIVVNACLDRLRRRSVRATQPWEEHTEEVDRFTPGSPGAPQHGDPVRAAEQAELRRAVQVALGQLPPEQRAALVLVDMEGYPVGEVARILDVPTGTLKSRCSRGRRRLRELLEAGNPGTDVSVPLPDADRSATGIAGGEQ